jgi:hypothetical protein
VEKNKWTTNAKKWISGFAPFQILLLVVSLLLIWIGIEIDSLILSTIGGALFGSALSNFFQVVLESDSTEKLFSIIKSSISPGFSSPVTTAETFHSDWYYYYVTRMEGKDFWRLTRVDFTKNNIPGKLLSRMALVNKEGEEEFYRIEGGVREGVFILFFDPEVRTIEPVMASLLPFHGATGPYYGVLYLMTWDHSFSFAPCIINRKPIKNWDKQQVPIPEEIAHELDELWKHEVTRKNELFPRINLFQ